MERNCVKKFSAKYDEENDIMNIQVKDMSDSWGEDIGTGVVEFRDEDNVTGYTCMDFRYYVESGEFDIPLIIDKERLKEKFIKNYPWINNLSSGGKE